MRVLHFFVVLLSSYICSASDTPASASITSVAVYYCPFDIKATLATDLSSIEILYDTSKNQSSLAAAGPNIPAARNSQKCYVQIRLTYASPKNSLTVRQIQYSGNVELNGEAKAGIDTLVALPGATGPVSYVMSTSFIRPLT